MNAAAAGLVEVRVPDMGNFKDVAIIDVLVKPGETIELETPLVTLETEKATMDVPSTVGGVVEKIHISKGGTVSTGDLIVTVRAAGGDAAGAGAGDASGAGGSADAGGSSGTGGSGGVRPRHRRLPRAPPGAKRGRQRRGLPARGQRVEQLGLLALAQGVGRPGPVGLLALVQEVGRPGRPARGPQAGRRAPLGPGAERRVPLGRLQVRRAALVLRVARVPQVVRHARVTVQVVLRGPPSPLPMAKGAQMHPQRRRQVR